MGLGSEQRHNVYDVMQAVTIKNHFKIIFKFYFTSHINYFISEYNLYTFSDMISYKNKSYKTVSSI